MRTRVGTVELVLIAPHADDIAAERRETVRVTLEGFEGDRHAGLTYRSGGRTPQFPRGTEIRNTRQVSILSAEELEEVAEALGIPAVTAESMGANLILRGIPSLTLLPPSTRLYFPDDAVLVVEGENLPCTTAGAEVQKLYPDVARITSRFPDAAMHKRGIVAWVERAGTISTGDEVRVEVPEQVIYDFGE